MMISAMSNVNTSWLTTCLWGVFACKCGIYYAFGACSPLLLGGGVESILI